MPEIVVGHDTPERLSALEAESRNTKSQITSIFTKLDHIENMLGQTQKTNWSLIFSVVALVGALWAAAIHPLNADQERAEKNAVVLADAVTVQNQVINTLKVSEAIQDSAISDLRKTQADFNDKGSPALDRRISLLELKSSMAEKKP